MFEIEKMENEFDYSLVDNDTAEFLRSCEYEMNGIAEDARIKFGKVLKKAQDKLSNNKSGIFQKWFESGGLDKNDVYYSINLYISSRNLDNKKRDNFLNAPKSLQKEVMKKNAPEDLKEKVYDGDITTNKEYQQLLKERKELEQRAKQAESQAEQYKKSEEIARKQLEEEQNKEPKVIEKEVIKEIDNTDYERIEQLQKEISIVKRELDEKNIELGEVNSNNEDLNRIKEDLNKLHRTKDNMLKGIDTAKEVEEVLSDVSYCSESVIKLRRSKLLEEIKESNSLKKIVIQETNDLVKDLLSLIDDLEDLDSNVIEDEIVV